MGASASKPEPVTRTVEEKYEVRTVQARAPHVFVTTARACAARVRRSVMESALADSVRSSAVPC